MEKFIVINYKYCPNFLRFKLILEWQEMNYESYNIENLSNLHSIVNQLIPNIAIREYIINIFNGSIILFNNDIIENTNHLLLKIFQIKKINLNNDLINILGKEVWIDSHFLYNFFWLSIGNNITNIFKKPALISEKNQVGNHLLIEKLTLLNQWFFNQPWILGHQFSLCDFSLFIIIKIIVEKNHNIMINYVNLYQWYLRMDGKKEWISFLK